MATINLKDLAGKLNAAMGNMRAALPGVPDDQMFVIAKALNGSPPAGPGFPSIALDKELLGAAVIRILKKVGTASRGEIMRTLIREGTIEDTNVEYKRIGDFLTTNIYIERVHRGLYRLLKKPVAKPASVKRIRKTVKAKPVVKPAPVKKAAPTKKKITRPDLTVTAGIHSTTLESTLKAAKALPQPFTGAQLKAALKCNTAELIYHLKRLHVAGKISGKAMASNGTKEWTVV